MRTLKIAEVKEKEEGPNQKGRNQIWMEKQVTIEGPEEREMNLEIDSLIDLLPILSLVITLRRGFHTEITAADSFQLLGSYLPSCRQIKADIHIQLYWALLLVLQTYGLALYYFSSKLC